MSQSIPRLLRIAFCLGILSVVPEECLCYRDTIVGATQCPRGGWGKEKQEIFTPAKNKETLQLLSGYHLPRDLSRLEQERKLWYCFVMDEAQKDKIAILSEESNYHG